MKQIAEDKRKDAGAEARADGGGRSRHPLLCRTMPPRKPWLLIDTMGNAAPKVLDASTAYRVAPDWAYGFPELAPGPGRQDPDDAEEVSNPGCYPTGAIALLRPIVDAGLLPADYPVTVNAVSGFSGGGKSMIASFEDGSAPAFELYGLGFEHKHVPEMQLYSHLTRRPIFIPSVGNFRQGMLVSVPVQLDALPGKPDGCRSAGGAGEVLRRQQIRHGDAVAERSQQGRPARAGGAQRDQPARALRLRQ